jgi:two-component system, sensor histidine kinase and response regulator
MNATTSVKSNPAVLLVDDTPANLELLAGMLKMRGYTVRAAVSGKLALAAVRNSPPDIILLDINMPEMNGYEVCAQLKAEEKLRDIPVIFISALSETMDKVKAFSAGGVDYVSKPFQLEEVTARVETHLELRRSKRELEEAYDKLINAERLRDALVHMIIHDLRSPLTGIHAFLELIMEKAAGNLPPDLVHYVDYALKAAKQMSGIIGDILETSQLEAGQLKLELRDCELVGAIAEVRSGLASLAGTRKIAFEPARKTVMVRADKQLMLRVIQNLLANALKFTGEGGLIRIAVSAAGDRARVSVQDDGPGISPEFREKIFEKFAQVELPAGRQKQSSGLGLTFCRLAVEAHGGRIGVDSEEGKGSTFWFELPVGGPAPLAGSPGPIKI